MITEPLSLSYKRQKGLVTLTDENQAYTRPKCEGTKYAF